MRQSDRKRRLAWAAVGLAFAAAVAGCGSAMPQQPAAVGQQAGFQTQGWPAAAVQTLFTPPGVTAAATSLGGALWGRPFAAGYGYPLILPQSSLYVGSGIELFAGTWPWRSMLYWGI